MKRQICKNREIKNRGITGEKRATKIINFKLHPSGGEHDKTEVWWSTKGCLVSNVARNLSIVLQSKLSNEYTWRDYINHIRLLERENKRIYSLVMT